MHRVLDQVREIAKTPAHVILCGEPGTGREMIAREIQHCAEPTDRPFVEVACSSQSSEVFEFDLFGCHSSRNGDRQERRALERIGRSSQLHKAQGGTIFFANLPDIPVSIQVRLARLLLASQAVVLEEKKRVNLSVRATAAVDHGYDEAVRDGRIHEDLHRVMSAFRIDVPPLRSRREDIPCLAEFFISESCQRVGIPVKQLSDSAHQLLAALPWHGNVSELRELLRELVQCVRSDVIDLPDVLSAVQIDGRAKPFETGRTLREARARFEREYIVAVLMQHHGRIPQAAKTLGIQRPNLYRKLRRLKVSKKFSREQQRART